MNWDETRDFLSPCFPECIRDELAMLLPGELREIRIRAERPAVFVTATRTAKLDWIPGQMQVEALTEALSGHSLFARADETRRGYLTLRGGHRMGLWGTSRAKTDRARCGTLRPCASALRVNGVAVPMVSSAASLPCFRAKRRRCSSSARPAAARQHSCAT